MGHVKALILPLTLSDNPSIVDMSYYLFLFYLNVKKPETMFSDKKQGHGLLIFPLLYQGLPILTLTRIEF